MDDELQRVLQNAAGLLEASVLVREVTFRPEDIPDVKVTVRIWFDAGHQRQPYRFELSHHAQSPSQASPYVSSPYYETEALALQRGISAITDWIEQGKRNGHSPESNWLKPSAVSKATL